MLDALKKLTGGSRTEKQAEDFQALILAAKEERSALNAMLAQIDLRGSKLAQVGKTLEQFDAKTVATDRKVTDVDKRIAGLEERTRTFAEIDVRIQELLTISEQAHQKAESLVAPDSDLQKFRKSVQHLSSQMLQSQAGIDALRRDQATLKEVRTDLRKTQDGVKSTIDGTAVVKGELDQVRGTADLIEFPLDHRGAVDRAFDPVLRLAQIGPDLFQGGLVSPEGINACLALEHLRREVLDGLSKFLEITVRSHQALRLLVSLLRDRQQLLDAHIDLRKRPGSFLEAGDALIDVSNLPVCRDRFRVELLERLADLCQLRTAQVDLREHGVEGASLFLRGQDQGLEILSLFFCPATARQLFECIEHDRPS